LTVSPSPPLPSDSARSGFEPALSDPLHQPATGRSGFEPELGGVVRQKAVYVDEATCIGCRFCAHVARNTFFIEPDHGRSRAIRQDGDPEELIQEAIDTCPVNCIDWVDYTELLQREAERQDQILAPVGFPVERSLIRPKRARRRSKP
jgi:ferredoxin